MQSAKQKQHHGKHLSSVEQESQGMMQREGACCCSSRSKAPFCAVASTCRAMTKPKNCRMMPIPPWKTQSRSSLGRGCRTDVKGKSSRAGIRAGSNLLLSGVKAVEKVMFLKYHQADTGIEGKHLEYDPLCFCYWGRWLQNPDDNGSDGAIGIFLQRVHRNGHSQNTRNVISHLVSRCCHLESP